MGKKAKAPKAPNYTALANQQAQLAQQQWQRELTAARPDQVGPTGSARWTQDASGRWTQTTAFNPEQQQVFDRQTQNQMGLAGAMGDVIGGLDTSQIDLSGAPAMPEVGGYNQQVIDTLRQLQAPDLQRRRAAKEAQLAAMGVGTGTGQAWNTEQSTLGDIENRADLESILAGIQQGNTQFGQGMQLHEQGVQDILAERAGNLGQLQGLAGLAQPVQMPQFGSFATPSATGAVPNITGAAGQQFGAAMNQYNANQQQNNSLLGGALSMATTAIPGGSLVGKVFGK